MQTLLSPNNIYFVSHQMQCTVCCIEFEWILIQIVLQQPLLVLPAVLFTFIAWGFNTGSLPAGNVMLIFIYLVDYWGLHPPHSTGQKLQCVFMLILQLSSCQHFLLAASVKHLSPLPTYLSFCDLFRLTLITVSQLGDHTTYTHMRTRMHTHTSTHTHLHEHTHRHTNSHGHTLAWVTTFITTYTGALLFDLHRISAHLCPVTDGLQSWRHLRSTARFLAPSGGS